MAADKIHIKESRMKRPLFIMAVLVAIAFAGPMLMKKPDGTPFMEGPWNSSSDTGHSSSVNASQSFYKWQDENGTWHYSDQPQVGKNIETVTVNTNANLIQSLKIEKKEEKELAPEVKKDQPDTPSIPLPMTVPLEKISKMLDDANNMQQLMDDRKTQIDRAASGR